ncbi:Phosphoenolpyruvate carboxylase [Haloterrigena turkmenica DSM 5511]|uniref:phosphoenolpyruvate carboxylase n=1 Tax=Haloterrigena turkmenica (strain ATCC 51198 / DSM 5511 / JCM 9101 / NCIMB 13204 / VKM B-1734 / 4k) TaxID=543526 RepID=D2RVU2_HALTV|nr:phosphoenolpyruvate carboxylase [Haloterrigena turkmenica]ADB61371.1 Phosphoenolpyruvate carboxylase [Haloterrigena turkmenica DSM 5511]
MRLHNREIRQDVRELGALLGDVLEDQTSRQGFETVESCRRAAIDYRSGDLESREPLISRLEGLSPHNQRIVARAFTTYFELINLAEERERVRTIRTESNEGTLEDSLEMAAEELGERGVDTVEDVLDDVLIEPTFTAHPTEARRKTVKSKLRTISTHLETLDERLLTEKEQSQVWRDIDAEVTSLWQTPQVRNRQPEPEDEARNVQWYLENTLFDVVGEVYDELADAIDAETAGDLEIPKLFEFRSWAGSDRDGNPYVTPEVTANVLERQREVVLEKYRDELKRLSGVLSQDGSRIDTGGEFEASLEDDRERLPGSARTAEDRYPGEPYRQKLKLMRERLARVGDVRPGGYDDVDELLDDLAVIAQSLRNNSGESVVEAHVDPIRRQVATFGFSLASLDLREHQQKHTGAIAEALEREGIDYRSLSEDERVELLTDAVLQDDPLVDLSETSDLSEDSARVLELFDSLGDWQTEYGVEAIDTYAISMTDEPSHVLEVLFLADQAGVVSLPEHAGIDIVPLLETEYALSGARRIMGTLFENEAYSQALEARGRTQEIMLGYSDSNKENGFLAANWSLFKNQRRLGEICDDYDVQMRLFHGRGGSISRGGGPMNEALLALPNNTITGQVKFTEQGEAIAEKYANPRIAERNIEQMLNAQLRARLYAKEEPDEEELPEEWFDAMETMADAARQEYRDLLESDGFVQYFEQATPISVIEDLDLGSRPASRSGERTVEDLRAIPWVFSWTQSRCILPGWYAVAAGIDAYLEDGGSMETMQEMYDQWPFFRTTLDNAALSLSRTELEIADQYADLADSELRERFFPRITDEYQRATELITEIGQREDLHTRDWLGENLARRNPYVDPLNVLQVYLLDRNHRTDVEERTLRLTVKGIAAGMKNTG